MGERTTRRRFVHASALAGGIAIAGCLAGADEHENGDEDDGADDDHDEAEDSQGEATTDYEIWALDQGADKGYIYAPDDPGADHPSFERVDEIDFQSLEGVTPNEDGAVTPHMIAFSSDNEYAAVATTGAGQALVFRAEDRELVASCPTGPGTHFLGFTPDDEYLLADVIHDAKITRVDADLGDEEFGIDADLHVADADAVREREDEFEFADGHLGPICHDSTGTGYTYHTLGPSIDNAGVVVLDWDAFEIAEAIPPTEVRANCGTIAHPSEDKVYLTAGAPSNHEPTGGVGEWYVMDANEHRPIDPDTGEVVEGEYTHEDVSRDSRGYDAHGFWGTPDEEELWLVNRETDDGVIIDPSTDEVIDEFETVEAPDIMWGSPDGRFMFFSLRGPEPVSGDPHASTGETPGFSVREVESRELVEVIQPDEDNPESDFHAIGVRTDGEQPWGDSLG